MIIEHAESCHERLDLWGIALHTGTREHGNALGLDFQDNEDILANSIYRKGKASPYL